jgi:predicted TIM-barrel fold metal-dependent hydrolase
MGFSRSASRRRGTLRENLRRLWYDTVNHEPAAPRCACEVLGTDRLLLGTDFPYAVGDRFRHCVQYVEEAGLPPDQTAAILGGTAQALLGLWPLPSQGRGRRGWSSATSRTTSRDRG